MVDSSSQDMGVLDEMLTIITWWRSPEIEALYPISSHVTH